MSGRVRNKVGLIAAVTTAIALMIPAMLALGDDDPIITGDSSVVLLTLGAIDEITWEAETQSVDLRNNCSIRFGSDPELLSIVGVPGALGHNKDGLGVRTGGSRGEPCGRTEADNGESITVSLGSDLSGYLMTAVDLDLELKFNASIQIRFLRDGSDVVVPAITFDGADSDDGPDSKDLDNYRFVFAPGEPIYPDEPVYFDTVLLTPTSGSFSLEGGADLSDNLDECDDGDADGIYPCGKLDDTLNTSSQIAVVETFDGEIDCGDIEPLGNATVSGFVTMHAEDGPDFSWTTDDLTCVPKPYNTDATNDSISFMPVLDGYVARYTFDVVVRDQEITTSGGQVTSLNAIYNDNGDLTFPDGGDGVEACNGTPLLVNDPNNEDYEEYWIEETLRVPGTLETPIMPDGDDGNPLPICFYSASVDIDGPDSDGVLRGTENWSFLIFADPGIGFR